MTTRHNTTPLHEQLAIAAARSGLTQRQLAEQIGVSQPQVNHWLTGRRPITLERAAEIAKICGCQLRIRVVRDRSTA